MQQVQVAELKSNFSDILKSIQNDGEKYIVEYGKKHEKVAMIIPYDASLEKQERRKFGLLQEKGSFEMKEDFQISDEELLGL